MSSLLKGKLFAQALLGARVGEGSEVWQVMGSRALLQLKGHMGDAGFWSDHGGMDDAAARLRTVTAGSVAVSPPWAPSILQMTRLRPKYRLGKAARRQQDSQLGSPCQSPWIGPRGQQAARNRLARVCCLSLALT